MCVCLHVTVHTWSEDRGQLCGAPSPRAQSQVAIRVRRSTFFVKPFGRPNLCPIANICPRNLCIVIHFELIIPAPNLEENFPKAALLVQKGSDIDELYVSLTNLQLNATQMCIPTVSLLSTLTILKTLTGIGGAIVLYRSRTVLTWQQSLNTVEIGLKVFKPYLMRNQDSKLPFDMLEIISSETGPYP